MSSDRKKRIGILGINHESNTFIHQVTTEVHFTGGHLFFGQDIISEYETAYHEIGGIIEGLQEPDIQIVPIMYAEATPGGVITRDTVDFLISNLLEQLNLATPLDGLMVVPHGAAVSEPEPDFDGFWISMVREQVGNIPIMGTLDLHANVSQQMVAAVDAFIPYRSNPHIDQREVGKKAAQLLVATIRKEIRPMQRLLSSQVAIGIDQQHTFSEPCKSLYALSKRLEAQPQVLSAGILLGFPYADVVDMGTSFLIVTDNEPDLALQVANTLDRYLQGNRHAFVGPKVPIPEALEQVQVLPKPVLLLDMGDNVGGGSPGDGTLLLQALMERNMRAFVCICDPMAVEQLQDHSPGDSISIDIGGKADQLHGPTLHLTITLKNMVDGKFHEKERRHGGQIHFDQGLSAIVETTGGIMIMITSKRMVPFSLQQLLQFDVAPQDFDAIVAKGVQAPIAAYAPVCPSLVRVNTPGITIADMTALQYKRRRKPLFPFEEIEKESELQWP